MTERLAQLMHDEADSLTIPSPQAATALARGRRARTRDRVLVGGAGVATTAVLVGAALVATNGADEPTTGRGLDPATAAYLDAGAFATGSTIHLPGGRDVTVEEKVKVLYYTSAGVLARTGKNALDRRPRPVPLHAGATRRRAVDPRARPR